MNFEGQNRPLEAIPDVNSETQDLQQHLSRPLGGAGPPPTKPFPVMNPNFSQGSISAQQLFNFHAAMAPPPQRGPLPPPGLPSSIPPSIGPPIRSVRSQEERRKLREEVLYQCQLEEEFKQRSQHGRIFSENKDQKDFVPSQEVIKFLEKNDIRPLKKVRRELAANE